MLPGQVRLEPSFVARYVHFIAARLDVRGSSISFFYGSSISFFYGSSISFFMSPRSLTAAD